MSVHDIPQLSFSTGLFDKRLRSRIDLERSSAACSEMENFYISLEGAAVRRPGTKFIGVANSAEYARLFPFTRDATNNFVLEMTEGKIRIIKDEFFLEADGVQIEIDTPYSIDEIKNLKYCQNADRMFFFVRSQPVHYLKRNSTTNWEFGEQEFVDMEDDPMFAEEGDYPGCGAFFQERFWLGGTDNQPQTIFGSKIGSYYDFSAAVLPDANVLPADSSWSQNNSNDFSSGQWRIRSSSMTEGYPVKNLSSGSASGDPWLSATDFSTTGTGNVTLEFTSSIAFDCLAVGISTRSDESSGYPEAFTIAAYDENENQLAVIEETDQTLWVKAEKRMFYFEDDKEIQDIYKITINFTKIEILQDTLKVAIGEIGFYPSSGLVDEEEASDEDFVEFDLAANSVNEILFMQPFNKKLVVGTSGGIWSSDTSAITRSDVDFSLQANEIPQENLLPICANNSLLFIMAGVNFAADYVYRLQYDDMAAENLSSFFRGDFTGKKIVSWAWQKFPENINWLVWDDGTMYGMSYQKDQKLFAWHKHSTQGLFRGNCSISTNDGFDEVYYLVERKVNGSNLLYIEKLSDYSTDKNSAAFVDCSLRYDNEDIVADEFSKFEHLAGCTCQVWAENFFQDVEVSTSGTFNIDYERNHVIAGLGYESRLTTMQKDMLTQEGSTIGRTRQLISATCQLNNAVVAKGGVDDSLEELTIQESTLSSTYEIVEEVDTPEIFCSDGGGNNSKFTVVCDQPVPLEVLSLNLRINFS